MRIRHLLTLATGALFLVIVSPPLPADDAIELKRQWITGKKYHRTIQNDATFTLDMGTAKVETDMVLTFEISETIHPPKKDQAKSMAVKHEREVMEVALNGKKSRYDSAYPDAPDAAKDLAVYLKNFIGRETTYLLDDHDKVASLAPNKASVTSTAPTDRPGALNKAMLVDLMQKTDLQSMPEHPVKPGDSWPFTTTADLPRVGQVAISGVYTFKGMGHHDGVLCAEITSEGKTTMDLSKLSPDSPLAKAGMRIEKMTLTGTTWFDVDLGTVREIDILEDVQIALKNPQDPSTSVSMPTQVKIRTALTKIEDAP